MPVKNKERVEAFSISDAHRLTIGIKCSSVAFRFNDFSGIVLLFFVSFLNEIPLVRTIAGPFARHQYGVMKNSVAYCPCGKGVSQEFRPVLLFLVGGEDKGLFLVVSFIDDLKKQVGFLGYFQLKKVVTHFIQNFE